jgi:hypothetical protein
MRIEQWKSHIKGYMISDDAKARIQQSIRQMGGIVFPAQEVKYYSMNNEPTAGGLVAQVNIALWNTHSILIAYPKTPNQRTVFENPCQVGVYLKVDNQQIPNEGYDTTGIIHLQDQIGIANLDGPLNPSPDFENSIINEHNKPDPGNPRYTNCLSDDTSYIAEFQTEHFDQAFVIDGKNTKGENIPIELVGKPKYSGPVDTYYLPDPAHLDRTNRQKPILLEVRDTFHVLVLDGLHYVNNKSPPGSQLNE